MARPTPPRRQRYEEPRGGHLVIEPEDQAIGPGSRAAKKKKPSVTEHGAENGVELRFSDFRWQ